LIGVVVARVLQGAVVRRDSGARRDVTDAGGRAVKVQAAMAAAR
jgi:hypothetical protein